ncbi:MAG: sulfotransferase-like domain-containing protein, partial [Planctomycetota bacterium]
MSGPVRVAAWSGPRNISTAFMRSWEARGDTFVWDEPLYAHFLVATGIDHPLREESIAAGETDWRRVVERCTTDAPDERPVFFQKHMAHHLTDDMELDWIPSLANILLIRDPRDVVRSYANKREEVTAADLGYVRLTEILDLVVAAGGEAPPVVDARDVQNHPEAVLRALCERFGVPFTERMLSWEPGRRPSDGVWGAHWYDSVETSTGFRPY